MPDQSYYFAMQKLSRLSLRQAHCLNVRLALAAVIFLSATLFAQNAARDKDQKVFENFESYHEAALRHTPSDISMKIAFKSRRTVYKFSEVVKVVLTFTTKNAGKYSVEQDLSNNPVGDLFVFRRADNSALELHGRSGYVCCGSRRVYLRQKPIRVISDYQTQRDSRVGPVVGGIVSDNAKIRDQVEKSRSERESKSWGTNLPPGEYDFFVKTHSLAEGWPGDLYLGDKSPLVVTSRNVLHITILR